MIFYLFQFLSRFLRHYSQGDTVEWEHIVSEEKVTEFVHKFAQLDMSPRTITNYLSSLKYGAMYYANLNSKNLPYFPSSLYFYDIILFLKWDTRDILVYAGDICGILYMPQSAEYASNDRGILSRPEGYCVCRKYLQHAPVRLVYLPLRIGGIE